MGCIKSKRAAAADNAAFDTTLPIDTVVENGNNPEDMKASAVELGLGKDASPAQESSQEPAQEPSVEVPKEEAPVNDAPATEAADLGATKDASLIQALEGGGAVKEMESTAATSNEDSTKDASLAEPLVGEAPVKFDLVTFEPGAQDPACTTAEQKEAESQGRPTQDHAPGTAEQKATEMDAPTDLFFEGKTPVEDALGPEQQLDIKVRSGCCRPDQATTGSSVFLLWCDAKTEAHQD